MRQGKSRRAAGTWYILGFVLFMVSVCSLVIPAQAAEQWSQYGSIGPISGTQPGELNSPYGVAVDSQGNMYVADTNNHRIQKRTAATGAWSTWGKSGGIGGFGGSGAGPGEFRAPSGVAVDSEGNVYVADTNNHRIQKLSASGNWLATWGKSDGGLGTGSGEFSFPYGVAVDSEGNVYVADTSNHRIQKRTAATGAWSTWGKSGGIGGLGGDGRGNGEFQYPYGVAADDQGNVYVADTFNSRIQKLNAKGTWLATWGGVPGVGNGEFRSPSGVTVDSEGNVYVADKSNHRIQKLSATGSWLGAWGKSGSVAGTDSGEFDNPNGVAIGSDGNMYVADSRNYRIQKLDAITNQWMKWGKEGNKSGFGVGEFALPNGIAVDSQGNMYVADRNNHRIQKRSAENGMWIAWGEQGYENGNFYSPSGVAADSEGNVYVADTFNDRIQKLSATGSWLATWGKSGDENGNFNGPSGVAVDSQGNVYVADRTNDRIQKLSATGSWLATWGKSGGGSGTGNGEFNTPSGVAVDSEGNVYVADSTNHRIQKLSAAGSWLATWGKSGGGSGTGNGEFNSPSGVTVDSQGNVYVADRTNDRIQKLSATGSWLATWGKSGGGSGTGNGEFRSPSGVAVDSRGHVYVADTNNQRIQKATITVVPGTPTGVTAAAGDGRATISFTAPAYDGGTDITGYTVTSSPDAAHPDGLTAVGTGSPIKVEGLTNGTTYTFTVVATNRVGNSAPSGAATATPHAAIPEAPVLRSSTAGGGQVTLAWDPVSGATGYKVFQSETSATYGTELGTVSGSVYSYSAAGLTYGTPYYFVVKATSAGGDSAASNQVSFTPITVPGTPTEVIAEAGDGQATVRFTLPANNGGSAITGYAVTANPGGKTVTGTVSPIIVTGLTNGITYTFTVAATNMAGNSAASNEVSATPQPPIPGVPVLATPVAGNGQVALTWSPVDGSTGYKVFQSETSTTYETEVGTVSGSVYSYIVTGLTNGKLYYFVVKAVSAGGDSAASNVVSAMPVTVPGVPTGITAVGGNGQATIRFTAPADNGGSFVTGYEVTLTPGTISGTGTTSPITVTGLSNGTNYAFTVTAINHVGSSVSSAVYYVTPRYPDNSSSGNNGSSSAPSGSNSVTSTDGKLTIPAGKTGKVSVGDNITMTIPAGAAAQELKITIDQVLDSQKLLSAKDVLVSSIFEIQKNVSDNFKEPATLTLSFDSSRLKDGQLPAIFYYDEAMKSWVKVADGKVSGSTITAKVNHVAKFAVFAVSKAPSPETPTTIHFTDIAGHWAEANINKAISGGLVSGYEDGTFKPGNSVTRAEFAVMLMNALKLPGESKALTFTDLAKIGAWAQKAVAQAVEAGIIQGYEDHTFRADAEITRAEMVAMIAKALRLTAGSNTATDFADDKDIPAWAKGAVAAGKKLGIVEGNDSGRFEPNAKTSRAEAVTVLLNMLTQKNK